MSELYLYPAAGRAAALTAQLQASGWRPRLAGEGNRIELVAVSAPDKSCLRFAAQLLRSEQVRSGGLFISELRADEVYLAAEWWGRFVIDAPLVETAAAAFDGLLTFEKAFAPRDLMIFAPLASGDEDDEDVDLGPIAARRESASVVLADPESFYGEFADPEIGGANALYAAGLEAAHERGLPAGEVLVGAPEAFGFERDPGEFSVVRWRRERVIAVHAAGFQLDDPSEVHRLFAAHEVGVEDQLADQLRSWRGQGLSYGIAVVLEGLQDPPVIIPVGSVFQQPSMGSPVQTLAAANAASMMVAAGATVPIVLPAYCLNRTFQPPAGPVVATPLVAPSVAGSQSDVWSGVTRRYRGRP